ncbi:unnamed protein product [Durusdinium trenchii]|uniref:non-specific serine/threonine protein kinase n=1 Tax=Durusdinium trenchii TaxID=1381693 RepID=A0ABP0Q6R3_9DINO
MSQCRFVVQTVIWFLSGGGAAVVLLPFKTPGFRAKRETPQPVSSTLTLRGLNRRRHYTKVGVPDRAEHAQRRIRSAENQHRSVSDPHTEPAPASTVAPTPSTSALDNYLEDDVEEDVTGHSGLDDVPRVPHDFPQELKRPASRKKDPSASAAAGLGAFSGAVRMTDAFEQKKTRQPIPVESWGPRPPSRAGLPPKAEALTDGFSTSCRGVGASSSSVGRPFNERETSQGRSSKSHEAPARKAEQALPGSKVVGGTWAAARAEPRSAGPGPGTASADARRGRERRATRSGPKATDLGVFGRGQPLTKSLSDPGGGLSRRVMWARDAIAAGSFCDAGPQRVISATTKSRSENEVKDPSGQLRVVKQLPWLGESDRENALREVRLLSSMRHPCIVPYFESFLVRSTPSLPSEDLLCLVMSRCDRDLRQECLRVRLEWELQTSDAAAASASRATGSSTTGSSTMLSKPHIPETQVLSWLAQLAWGLQHLHSRKFLHRDLKPQNVLLAQQGKRVMLADFGVAGQVEHTEDLRRSIVGTPAFMSPEMLEGRPYNSKTDQWALGCVLFEMMALEPPFAGRCDSYAAVVSAVLHAPPVEAPDGYSEPLSSALQKLLARKPHHRPSNRELLRSQVLRDPFHDFLQSLDITLERKASLEPWAKSRSSLASSPPPAATPPAAASPPPTAPPANAAGGSARRAVPYLRQLHAPDAHGLNGHVMNGANGVEDVLPSPSSSDATPSKSHESSHGRSQDLGGTGGSSNFMGYGKSTPGLPGLVEDELGSPSRSPYPSVQTEGCGSYPSDFESDSGAPNAAVEHSEHSSDQEMDFLEDLQVVEDETFPDSSVTRNEWRNTEWRQLLAEAEALLVPLPEVHWGEETQKLRHTLSSSLGGDEKVDQALNFLRDRRPLGDTMEADELLLQVELMDLLGEEGIQNLFRHNVPKAARPVLAEPQALEVSGCGLGDAWPASPQSCGGTPPTRRPRGHGQEMQMEDVEVDDHVLHPNFRRGDATPPQVIVTRSHGASRASVGSRGSGGAAHPREGVRHTGGERMPFPTSLDVDFLTTFDWEKGSEAQRDWALLALADALLVVMKDIYASVIQSPQKRASEHTGDHAGRAGVWVSERDRSSSSAICAETTCLLGSSSADGRSGSHCCRLLSPDPVMQYNALDLLGERLLTAVPPSASVVLDNAKFGMMVLVILTQSLTPNLPSYLRVLSLINPFQTRTFAFISGFVSKKSANWYEAMHASRNTLLQILLFALFIEPIYALAAGQVWTLSGYLWEVYQMLVFPGQNVQWSLGRV